MATPQRDDPPPMPWLWLLPIVVAGVAMRVVQLGSGLYGEHTFRQTQTLWPIRGFVDHGIDFFSTYLPIFGDQQNVPFELPLYQAVAALPAELGLSVLTSARLTTLVSFEVTALLWACLLTRWVGPRAAVVAMLLFQVLPFGIEWGVVPLIDFFSVALGTACVVLFDGHLRWGRTRSLVAAVLLCWLTLLVKVTTFPSTGILLLLAAVLAIGTLSRADLVRRVLLFGVAGPGVGVLLLLAWTHWADGVKAGSPTTTWLVSSNLEPWNFATMEQRTNLDLYLVVLDGIKWQISGIALFGIVLGVVACLITRRHRTVVLFLLLAAATPVLIHFNLYVVHEYYLIAIYPVLVAIAAIGVAELAMLVRPGALRFVATVVLVALVVGSTLTNFNGQAAAKSWDPEEYQNRWATSLLLGTKPDDRIVLVRCDWDPAILWLGQRTGLMITGHETSPVPWERITEDYAYLLVCGGDPHDIEPREVSLTPAGQPDLYTIDGWTG